MDVRDYIDLHRKYAIIGNMDPCNTGCPFASECMHCVELFPAMIDFVECKDNGIRRSLSSYPKRPYVLGLCPCNVMGKETISKLVAIYMGEY